MVTLPANPSEPLITLNSLLHPQTTRCTERTPCTLRSAGSATSSGETNCHWKLHMNLWSFKFNQVGFQTLSSQCTPLTSLNTQFIVTHYGPVSVLRGLQGKWGVYGILWVSGDKSSEGLVSLKVIRFLHSFRAVTRASFSPTENEWIMDDNGAFCLHLYVHFFYLPYLSIHVRTSSGTTKGIWKNLPVISPEKHALQPFTKEIWSVS